jgi:hypothetical protein
MGVEVNDDLDGMLGEVEHGEDLYKSLVADSVEGITEVYIHGEDVIASGCCIFDAADEGSDLISGVVVFSEPCLGMAENVVFFHKFAEGVIK